MAALTMPVDATGTRLLAAAAVVAAAAAGVESVTLAVRGDWYSFGDTSTSSAVLGFAAGAAVLVAGTVQVRSAPHRVQGTLLVAAAAAWLITVWEHPSAPAWIFLAGRIFGTGWPVVVAHAALRSYGPLGRSERVAAISAYIATIGFGLTAALVVDPAAAGCADCPVDPLLLADRPRIADGLDRGATLAGSIWAVVLAAALARRLIRATSARRRISFPMTIVAMALLGTVAAGYLRSISRGLPETDDIALWTTASGLLVLFAFSTGWPAVSLALTRHKLATLVVQASEFPVHGGVSGVLGTALHDPTVRLLYRREGEVEDYLIDAAGEPAQPDAELTPLIQGADTVAYLDHAEPLVGHEGAVIAQVARLSLNHERLHAFRAAQLRELRASRVRIVAAADHERRRLERNLHDGGQQRLVSLALGLQLAELTAGPAGAGTQTLLAAARTEVAEALADLRVIARGLYPRELADEGLESALETFAENDPTPVGLDSDVPERLPHAVESAAYFAVVHFLGTTEFDPLPGRAIRAWLEGASLQVEVSGSRTADLTPAVDRVGALGGSVERLGVGSIRIGLPCAW